MQNNNKNDITEANSTPDTECSDSDDMFKINDIKQRRLFLDTVINQTVVSEIIKHIIRFNKEDKEKDVEKRQPIFLYIASEGGDEVSGFSLIDFIQNSITPVYTVNIGEWSSMACLIGLSGHKRFAIPNAQFLLHDGITSISNSSAKVKDTMKFVEKMEDRIRSYVLSRSNITSDEYDSRYRTEWYMFAKEAREKGIVDYIVGEHCSFNDII